MNATDTDNTNRHAIDRLLLAEAGPPCPHCHGTGELSRVPQVVELAYPDGETVRVLIAGDDYGD